MAVREVTYISILIRILAAFALGLCWQLPQCFALLAGNGMGLAVMPDFFAGLGLCCVGSIGGVCAAACLNRQS